MSAYIVNRETIAVLVHEACRLRVRWCTGRQVESPYGGEWAEVRELRAGDDAAHELLGEVGQMLAAANVRSVNYRYSEDDWGDVYVHSMPAGTAWASYPVTMVRYALDCFEYQACEPADWFGSEAHRFCLALRAALLESVPGPKGPGDWSATDLVARALDFGRVRLM